MVTARLENHILKLALNRPEKRNALNPDLLTELQETSTLFTRHYKNYKYVQFFNGGYFSTKLPSVKYELKNIDLNYGKQEWGAEPNKIYFVLTLGKQLNP